MDVFTAFGLVSVVVLVFANAFFVATEFAIVAIRRSRLEQLVGEGRRGAKAAQDLVGHLDSYIAACQFGITIASLSLGWIGEPALAHLIEPPLESLFGSFAPAASHTIAVSVAFSFITALHIVIGELAPKGLALQRTEGTALFVAVPMQIFYWIFRWPINLLNLVGNAVLKLLGMKPASGHELVHSVAEVRFLLEGMEQAGVVEKSGARIANRAFDFGGLTARAVLTPRTSLEALPVTSSISEIVSWAKSTTHRRLLIYQDTLDHVIGLVHIGDIFHVIDQPPDQFDMHRLLRPVNIVPSSQPADVLLEEMRAARQQLVVVVDEHGATAGIITIEDLVEALVGRIDQESLLESAPGYMVPVRHLNGSSLLDGLTPLAEFRELVGTPLPRTGNVHTLGGLVTMLLGHIPQVGETVELVDHTLRVEELDGLRVATVRILPAHRD